LAYSFRTDIEAFILQGFSVLRNRFRTAASDIIVRYADRLLRDQGRVGDAGHAAGGMDKGDQAVDLTAAEGGVEAENRGDDPAPAADPAADVPEERLRAADWEVLAKNFAASLYSDGPPWAANDVGKKDVRRAFADSFPALGKVGRNRRPRAENLFTWLKVGLSLSLLIHIVSKIPSV
jgi:hypothetical protein